jgi:hypothetical protein
MLKVRFQTFTLNNKPEHIPSKKERTKEGKRIKSLLSLEGVKIKFALLLWGNDLLKYDFEPHIK